MSEQMQNTRVKPVLLTGDRPTGPLHLGHYVGSLKNRVSMQETHDSYILVADTQSVILPIGGYKEKPFFNLTVKVARMTENLHRIIPLIVPTGEFPVYYPFKKGDALIGDSPEALKAFQAPREIEGDFRVLEKHMASFDKLCELATKVKKQMKVGERPDVRERQVAGCSGWDGPTG